MTKTLIKKQMLEVFSWLYQNKKTGKNRDKKGIIIYSFLYILLFGLLAFIFYQMADSLCAPLINAGFGWLYMALMGIIGVTFGVFGSVFNTFASLYQAKDNDLLLSMPIPVKSVLTARLSGVYAMGLLYEMLVMIPAVIAYFIVVKLNAVVIIFSVLIPFILSFFVLAFSCILGFVVALINSKLKNQKILTVIVSLAFFGVYYYFCGNASRLLQSVILNPENIAGKIKGFAYPLYHMGLAAEGKTVSMLIFTGIIAVVFLLVYAVLQYSFLRLATANKGAAKVKYVEKKAKAGSADKALLQKEFKRFFESPNYMLNCGLGIVIMIVLAVVILFKQNTVNDIISIGKIAGYEGVISLLIAASICMMITMNDISAPSVSLEGKNLWIVQVLPVSGWQILKAKLNMHIILNIIPAIILTVCVEYIFKPSVFFGIMIPVTVILFIILMAAFGLFCNLKAPNLNWTNEVSPIKQSLSVTLTLFGGWLFVLALGFIYYWIYNRITAEVYLICVNLFLVIINVILLKWLKKRGSHIIKNL